MRSPAPVTLLHSGGFLDKRVIFVFIKRLLQFFLRVHDNGATPCNGFAERFSGEEQEPHTLAACTDNDRVTLITKQGYCLLHAT